MIGLIWEMAGLGGRRTAYNRNKAHIKYLRVARQRKPRKRQVQNAIKDQLSYLKKNLELIDSLPSAEKEALKPKHLERLETIRKVVRQQTEMLENKTHIVEDRIVNLRQPHVRPIVRGKIKTPVEFGQKLGLSVINGFTFIDKQSWDNFSEGVTLIESTEKYKARHGVYPTAILADKTYRNRTNINFCKEHGIRLSGPRLGRPKAEDLYADRQQAYRDGCDRNMIESRNGIAKRRYGLDLIMAKLSATAETEAALNLLAMNIDLLLRVLLRLFSKWLCGHLFNKWQMANQ
jgi:hypothetical protein